MPELPEVETIRRGLIPILDQRRILEAEIRRPDLRVPFPPDFAARLTGRKICRLERRAKYLLLHLDDGMVVIMHLGMSGRLFVETAERAADRHDHVILRTDQNRKIVFNDHRRFGLMLRVSGNELAVHPLLKDLGPEPLSDDFNAEILCAALEGRKTPIKAALLDQHVVAGLGNIYVCEALWRAGISPRRLAMNLGMSGAARLAPAVKSVLLDAIEAGGSSLKDYVQASGEMGYFQHRFAVHDRDGANCARRGCAGRVRRIVQSNRSSFYCGTCQR